MKSLLFITPSRQNNGTNSSLSSIYDVLKSHYNIKIISIESKGEGSYEFVKVTSTPALLDLYYQDFIYLKKKQKISALLVKCVKRITRLLKIDLETFLFRYTANYIEKKESFDYIVGFQEGIAMKFAAQFENPNKLTWIHCDYARAFPETHNELHLYDRFKKIICVSNFTRDRFISRYPTLGQKTVSIYNLLDKERIEYLSNLPIDDCRFKTEYFTIVSLGRMDPIKRFTLIPSIAKKIKERNLNFDWYILGGPENDIYKEIEKLIHENNVSDCVTLLGYKKNPYVFLRHSNLLVATSSSEACPMIFNEAKLCKVPILSADFGSANEFIEEGKNGVVVSINNIVETISNIIGGKYLFNLRVDNNIVDNNKIISNINSLFS